MMGVRELLGGRMVRVLRQMGASEGGGGRTQAVVLLLVDVCVFVYALCANDMADDVCVAFVSV